MLPFCIGIFNSGTGAVGYAGPLYSDVITGDSPVGWWRLDDTSAPFTDSGSAADDFELTGTDITYGTASPTGTGITIGSADSTYLHNVTFDTSIASNTEGSIEVWFKRYSVDSASGEYFFTLLDDTTYNRFVQIRFHPSTPTIVSFRYRDNDTLGTNNYLVKTNEPINILNNDGWHHIVVVSHPTGSPLIYINGALSVTTTHEGSPSGKWFANLPSSNTTQSMTFKWNGGQNYSRGSISELAVYDYRLNAGQVLEHYEAGRKVFDAYSSAKGAVNPIAYWKFDESVDTLIDEISGLILYSTGKINCSKPSLIKLESYNHAVTIDGSYNSWFIPHSTPSYLQIVGDMSFYCWLSLTNVTTEQIILTCGEATESSADNFLYRIHILSTKQLRVLWEYGSGSNETITTVAATSITTNTPFHFGFIRDTTNKNVHFYINGELFETVAYTNNPSGGSNTKFSLGADWVSASHYPILGQIDELAIYNKLIGSQDIRRAYNKGINDHNIIILRNEPRMYYKFNDTSTPIVDYGSLLDDGSIVGTDITYEVTGPVPGSKGITIGTADTTYWQNTSLTTELATHTEGTIECWFKPHASETEAEGILFYLVDTGSVDYQFHWKHSNTTHRIYYYFRNGTGTPGTNYYIFGSKTPILKDNWNHIALVSHPTGYASIYINGELQTNELNSGSPSGKWFSDVSSTNNCMAFKRDYSGTDLWSGGSMHGLAIYKTRLTAEDIKKRFELALPNNTYVENVKYTKPTAYWRMDELSGNITDIISSAVCTTNGTMEYGRTSLCSDPYDTSIYLNGGYFSKTTSFQYISDMSFHCWVTFDAINVNQCLVMCGGTGETEAENYAYKFSLTSANKLQLFWEYSTGTDETVITTSAITVKIAEPIFLGFARCVSYSNQVHFYVNGEIFETVSFTNDPTGATTADFYIGIDGETSSQPVIGTIDEVAIYDKEIGESAFKRIYDVGISRKIPQYTESVLSSKPVGYWKFNDSTTTFKDYGSAADSFVKSGTDLIQQVAGPYLGQQAVQLGTANTSYLGNTSFATELNTHTSGSIEFWYKRHTNETGDVVLLCCSDSASTYNYSHITYNTSMDKLTYYFRNTASASWSTDHYRQRSVTLNLLQGNWCHIVIVSDDTSLHKLYINGIEISFPTEDGSPSGKWFDNLTTPNTFRLGELVYSGSPSAKRGFNMSDLVVYDYKLTADQIKHNYDNARKSIYVPQYSKYIVSTSPLAYWRMDETSGNVIDEISSYSLTGSGTRTYSSSPLIKNGVSSISFNNGYFSASISALRLTGDISAHLWATVDNSTTTTKTMIACGTAGETSETNFLYRFALTNNKLELFWEYSSGSDESVITTSTFSWIVGKRYHLGFTRDTTANEVSFYVDGELFETVGYTNDPSGGGSTVFYIGDESGGFPHYGNIDEVAVYNSKIDPSIFRTAHALGR